MKSFFLTATGTDQGKTFLAEYLLSHSQGALRPLKPVVSGWSFSDQTGDSQRLLKAAGLDIDPESIEAVSPWRYSAALSPDQAVAEEGGSLPLADVTTWVKSQLKQQDCLVEGAGGLFSPLASDGLNLNLAEQLQLPIVMVSRIYLGSISHTISAYQAAAARNHAPACIVLNTLDTETTDLHRLKQSLKRYLPADEVEILVLEAKLFHDDALYHQLSHCLNHA